MSLFVQSAKLFHRRGGKLPPITGFRIGLRTNLQCIFPRKALLAMAAGEWLHCQMDTLVSLQVVVSVEGLWALVALEGAVVWWRLALGVMPVHLMRMLRVSLHVHAAYQRHLVSGVVHVAHDGTGHCWQIVPAIRPWVALGCGHRGVALCRDGGNAIRRCGGSIRRLLGWGLLGICGESRLLWC